MVKCKCENCNSLFEATGNYALGVLTGGIECPNCKGNVNVIVVEK